MIIVQAEFHPWAMMNGVSMRAINGDSGKLDVCGVELPAVEKVVDEGIEEMLGEVEAAFEDDLEETEALR